jgi:serine protease Do
MHNTARSLVVVSAFILAAWSPARADDSIKPAMQARADFRQIVQDGKSKVFPAVVYIKVVREYNEQGEKKSQEISGSGVIISPEGEVLTNWHVVDKAENVRCLLTDGRAMTAKVLGSDKDVDLALIKLEGVHDGPTLPYASFGDSRVLKEGDFVMAMGAPWGLNRSVSIGIISCAKRYLEGISEYSHWLQTDAPINPGNSGGPLVNTDGQIIGINARGMNGGADGMGFAIPSETAQVMVEQMRTSGRVNWSWFGLQLQPLRDFNKDTYFDGAEGVIVAETDPDSPARAAGLQGRDRLLSVNGAPLNGVTEEDLAAIRRTLGLLPKGQEAAFLVQRGTDTVTIKIAPREKGAVEGKEVALKRWDLTVKEINQFDNQDLFFYRNKGVFVYATKYPGNAANAGLRNGDIIVKIEDKEITTMSDIEAIQKQTIEKLSSKPRIVFTVMRAGLTRQVVLDMQRDYSKE